MQTNIDIHDLSHHLDQIRRMADSDSIVITSGNAPIARLVPLEWPSVDDPDFTPEEVRRMKAALASNQPRYTTQQVIDFVLAHEQK